MPRKQSQDPSPGSDPQADEFSAILEAISVRGSVLHHHKGYYTYVIYDTFEDADGTKWVLYFNADNCGTLYQEFDGTFLKQFNQDVDPAHLVKENFYKQNQMQVASLDRFLERNSEGGLKVCLKKPSKKVPFDPTHITITESGMPALVKGSKKMALAGVQEFKPDEPSVPLETLGAPRTISEISLDELMGGKPQ